MRKNLFYFFTAIVFCSCGSEEKKTLEKNISEIRLPEVTGVHYGTTERSVRETYDQFSELLGQNENISIVAELDHSQNAASAGMELPPTRVIFFGNPELGTPLMQKKQLTGLDLPQRVLIFEEDNKTTLVYNSPSYLEERYNLTGVGSLEKISEALEKLTGSVVDSMITGGERKGIGLLKGIETIKSTNSFDETYSDLQEAIRSNASLSIVTELDHQANARSVGMELRPTRIIIFGNPELGTPLIQDSRTVALDLPQKMLVWEDEDGTVNISFNSPEYLKARHRISGHEAEIKKMAAALNNLARTAAGL